MANKTLKELYIVSINEELSLRLEKCMQEKEGSIGEENGTCFI